MSGTIASMMSMPPGPGIQVQAKALGDPSRYRIFRYILDAPEQVSVAELTSYTQLNHNAVRQHLAVLCDAGLVLAGLEQRSKPGRPRLLYSLNPEVAGAWGTSGPYEYIAQLLAEMVRTGDDPETVGRRAGLARSTDTRDRAPDGLAASLIIREELERSGFRPRSRLTDDGEELLLGRCPYASVAAASPDSVCGLHLGIANGLAEGIGGVKVADLKRSNPYQGGCRLSLIVTEPGPDATEAEPGAPEALPASAQRSQH